MIVYKVEPCEDIDTTADIMCALSKRQNESVCADFNGITLVANPNSIRNHIVDDYMRLNAARFSQQTKKAVDVAKAIEILERIKRYSDDYDVVKDVMQALSILKPKDDGLIDQTRKMFGRMASE